jgi:hypothetical protein
MVARSVVRKLSHVAGRLAGAIFPPVPLRIAAVILANRQRGELAERLVVSRLSRRSTAGSESLTFCHELEQGSGKRRRVGAVRNTRPSRMAKHASASRSSLSSVEQPEMSKWPVIGLLVHRPLFDFSQTIVGAFDFLQYLLCVWILFSMCALLRKFRSFHVLTQPQ